MSWREEKTISMMSLRFNGEWIEKRFPEKARNFEACLPILTFLNLESWANFGDFLLPGIVLLIAGPCDVELFQSSHSWEVFKEVRSQAGMMQGEFFDCWSRSEVFEFFT